MSHAANSRPARGFALSELGIVVGLVVVTLAVLTPAVKHAREDARARICLANQGMIVRGLALYVADEQVYPFSFMEGGTNWKQSDTRYALGCLSRYVGGPATSVLEGKTEGQFPAVYICPSADKPAVFASNPTTMYQACYWVNQAVRVNMAFKKLSGDPTFNGMALLVDYYGSGVPGDDSGAGSAGSSRIFGKLCPQATNAHWRSLYHPRPDTVRNPGGMMFTGDTNNVVHNSSLTGTSNPGNWQMKPGWGIVEPTLGFERHGNTIGVSYVDGHTRSFAKSEIQGSALPKFADGLTTGWWLARYVGTDGCVVGPNYQKHKLPAAVCN